MTEQQVILQRQEKDQQEKVKASVPDKKKLTQLENQVEHLKKGKRCHILQDDTVMATVRMGTNQEYRVGIRR